MKATVKELKENREEIISVLINLFGEENLRTKMTSLLNIVEEAEIFGTHGTIDECIEVLIELSQSSIRKTSKLAEIHGNWMEQKEFVRFNHLTKEYEEHK